MTRYLVGRDDLDRFRSGVAAARNGTGHTPSDVAVMAGLQRVADAVLAANPPGETVELEGARYVYAYADGLDQLNRYAEHGWRIADRVWVGDLADGRTVWVVESTLPATYPDLTVDPAVDVVAVTPQHARCVVCQPPTDVPVALLIEHMVTVHGHDRTQLAAAPVEDRTDEQPE